MVGTALLGLVLAPVASYAFTIGAAGGGDSFIWGSPTYSSKPKEQLYVRSMGPGSASPSFTYAQNPSYPTYQPVAYSYPTYGYQNYGYQYAMPTYQTYNYAPYYDWSYGGTGGYSYGSSYSYPSYGYTYPNQVPGTDLWGNDMCYWGAGYNNFPCDRDPHQWVFDPYTSTYY